MNYDIVTPFSIGHLLALMVAFIAVVIVYNISIRFKNKRIIFAHFMLLFFLFDNVTRVVYFDFGSSTSNVYNLLPLSLCGLNYVLSLVALYTNNNKIFKFTYFITIGAVIALIAPSESGLYSFTSFQAFRYNSTHMMIIASQVFMYSQLNFKIEKNDGLRAFVTLIIVSSIMFVLNSFWGTNFFFVNEPLSSNAIGKLLGEFPKFLIWYILISFVFMILLEKITLLMQLLNRKYLNNI